MSARKYSSTSGGDLERVSDRVFHVLNTIHGLGPGAHSLNVIVERAELSRSTVQRIINSGLRKGMVVRERHGWYALADVGARRLRMHDAPISVTTREVVGSLRRRVDHAIGLHIAILVGAPCQVCIEFCAGSEGIPDGISQGMVRPLDADAAGKVILAHLGTVRQQANGSRRIRSQGFAASSGPAHGWSMLAVPILSSETPVGSISLTGRQASIEQEFAACVTALMDVKVKLVNNGRPPA